VGRLPGDGKHQSALVQNGVLWRMTRIRHATSDGVTPDRVLDDADDRSFDTTAAYWCARNLPPWLGYGPAL
jgi:hypothetical protein